MASVFPGAIKSFTPKTDGVDKIYASHVNDLQDEVAAIETELKKPAATTTVEAANSAKLDNRTVADLLLLMYPVGSIYMSVVSTNPSSLFGGTWVAWGAGKVPVSRDSGDPDFDTSEETGGSKTHNHSLSNLGIAKGAITMSGFLAAEAVPNMGNWTATRQIAGTQTGNTEVYTSGFGLKGVTDTATDLPPYIVCYMWKRTA